MDITEIRRIRRGQNIAHHITCVPSLPVPRCATRSPLHTSNNHKTNRTAQTRTPRTGNMSQAGWKQCYVHLIPLREGRNYGSSGCSIARHITPAHPVLGQSQVPGGNRAEQRISAQCTHSLHKSRVTDSIPRVYHCASNGEDTTVSFHEPVITMDAQRQDS